MSISPSQRYIPFDYLRNEDTHVMQNYGTIKYGTVRMAKNDFLLKIMDGCTLRCNLAFSEQGIQDKAKQEVRCFDNCLKKSYEFYVEAQTHFNEHFS